MVMLYNVGLVSCDLTQSDAHAAIELPCCLRHQAQLEAFNTSSLWVLLLLRRWYSYGCIDMFYLEIEMLVRIM